MLSFKHDEQRPRLREVIETLPLDILLSLGLGMTFSMAQDEKEKDKGSVFSSTYFLVGLVFHFVVAFGVALACYIMYPDWMMMYFGDRRKVPKAIIGYIFTGYFAMYVLGFLVVPPLKKLHRGLPLASFISLMAFIFFFIGITFSRLWHVGDFEEYHRGEAPPITETPLFSVLGLSMPGAVGGLVAVLLALRRRFEREGA